MFHPTRGGTRGGQGDFKWSDVANDKDREHYLGHSINAPVGRWQKNRDITWYNKENDKDAEKQRRDEEIARIKQAEEDAIASVLGYRPKPSPVTGDSGGSSSRAIGPSAGTGSNMAPLDATKSRWGGDPSGDAKDGEDKLSKSERKIARKLAKMEVKAARKAAKREARERGETVSDDEDDDEKRARRARKEKSSSSGEKERVRSRDRESRPYERDEGRRRDDYDERRGHDEARYRSRGRPPPSRQYDRDYDRRYVRERDSRRDERYDLDRSDRYRDSYGRNRGYDDERERERERASENGRDEPERKERSRCKDAYSPPRRGAWAERDRGDSARYGRDERDRTRSRSPRPVHEKRHEAP